MIEIPDQGVAFFASDLHLSKSTPKTVEAFENWLSNIAQPNTLLFLLGDLFEVWYGDDYSDSITKRVAQATRSASEAGATVYFMHGNRDFLLGENYAERAKLEILPDPEFLLINQQIILITHGDELCSDDKAYQKFRQESRGIAWQKNFLGTPLEKRIDMANAIRSQSEMHKAKYKHDIMDVNLSTVVEVFQGKWPGSYYVGKSDVIVHGHTHRCAIHTELNTPAPQKPESVQGSLTNGLRIVLPDWNFDHTEKNAVKGGFLKIEKNGQYHLNLFH